MTPFVYIVFLLHKLNSSEQRFLQKKQLVLEILHYFLTVFSKSKEELDFHAKTIILEHALVRYTPLNNSAVFGYCFKI